MAQYNTPGVYVEEISVFPGSIAGVATAVPAFIGYVEKAENNGVGIPFYTPVRLTSLLDYQAIFGGAAGQDFFITIDDTTSGRTISVVKDTDSIFRLYYNIQMYFANGGGPCYVVPVGLYSSAGVIVSELSAGLDAVAKVDEPTLLLCPDALSLNAAFNKSIYDAALAQCAKLTDRFTIMDVRTTTDPAADAAAFRNTCVGPDNLKYGAAYYPNINTTLNYGFNPASVHITTQTINGSNPSTYSQDVIDLLNDLEQTLILAKQAINFANIAIASRSTSNVTTYVGYAQSSAVAALAKAVFLYTTHSITQYAATNSAAAATKTKADAAATAASAFTGNDATAHALMLALQDLVTSATSTIATAYSDTTAYSGTLTAPNYLLLGSLSYLQSTNPALYNSIMAQISNYTVKLNPSGAMAGIYARVDNDRGVWKAPANVGVQLVTGPVLNVTNAQQDGLNVDATSGKSINVIRSFTGRGTLVWGARTLAGNDNEWRYINVRRLFIYVEESIAEATEFVVFEPNTANTWQRVKGMIEAFLTGLWRNGGLAGATTKDAFFVNVGLGVTMTAQDILEGRMIVTVGLAAVRPAEFIILRFEHKLQES